AVLRGYNTNASPANCTLSLHDALPICRGPSDVVHLGPGLPRFALRDIGDRDVGELLAQRLGGVGPDAAGGDRLGAELALEQVDDLEHRHLGRGAGERVAALHAALALEDTRAAQRREQPLEELDGDVAAARQLADRD